MTFSKAINRSVNSILPKAFLLSGIFSGLCLITSCTSLHTLVIDVEKPALITLPNDINTIVIVDNSVPQDRNIGHAEYIHGKRTDSQISIDTDSLNHLLVANLFEKVADKEYFDDVILYEQPLREDADFSEALPLDTAIAKEICIANNADAVLSLDRFLLTTTSNEEDFDFGATLKVLDAKMDVRFQVYSNEGKAISPPLYINDSIYWAATYSNNIPIADSLPSRNQAVKEATQYMAGKIADALAPYWSNEPRWYFGDVKPANKMMLNNDWAGALSLWKSAYEKEEKNIKKKARLANNIALAYELSDEMREALKWITISCDLFTKKEETSFDTENLTRATNYKNDLLTRYSDFRLLDMRDKQSK